MFVKENGYKKHITEMKTAPQAKIFSKTVQISQNFKPMSYLPIELSNTGGGMAPFNPAWLRLWPDNRLTEMHSEK